MANLSPTILDTSKPDKPNTSKLDLRSVYQSSANLTNLSLTMISTKPGKPNTSKPSKLDKSKPNHARHKAPLT